MSVRLLAHAHTARFAVALLSLSKSTISVGGSGGIALALTLGSRRNPAVGASGVHKMVRAWLASSLSVFLVAVPAFAAESGGPAADQTGPSIVISAGPHASRGPILPVLYGTLAGLEAYDGWSTVRATTHGASEANPVLVGLASNSGAMWAVKVGSTMASIYAAESLWRRHHRAEAVVMMVVVNGAMATVAVRNASVIRGLK
jgi:hypothetical protein